jgi:hypothetical protein
MGDNTKVHKILTGILEGKKPPGRPKRIWD